MQTFKVTRQISATKFQDSLIEAETEKEAWDNANIYPFGIVTKIKPVKVGTTLAQLKSQAKNLRQLQSVAMNMQNAAQFGRLEKELEANYRQYDALSQKAAHEHAGERMTVEEMNALGIDWLDAIANDIDGQL